MLKKTANLNLKPIFTNKSKPIFIPNWRVQDIDTLDDWIRAEYIFSEIKYRKRSD